MTQELVIEIASTTLYYTMLIAGPILITGLLVGIFVSMFQTVTQIKEQTMTFIPKITAVMLVMLVALPWMMNRFLEYIAYIMGMLSTFTQ